MYQMIRVLIVLLLFVGVRVVASEELRVSCCDVWAQLTTYTVEKTGSSLAVSRCEEHKHECPDIKLIEQFYAESNAALHNALTRVDANSDFVLGVGNTTDSEAMLRMLVFAFLGRTISRPDLNHNGLVHRYLEYDIQGDKLTMRTPSCEFNKSIYTAMVLVSTSLLMFLIGMQIVDKHRKERQEVEVHGREHGVGADGSGAVVATGVPMGLRHYGVQQGISTRHSVGLQQPLAFRFVS